MIVSLAGRLHLSNKQTRLSVSQLGCVQSLLPLHSAVSYAWIPSCLGIDSRSSRSLSQVEKVEGEKKKETKKELDMRGMGPNPMMKCMPFLEDPLMRRNESIFDHLYFRLCHDKRY
nr:uncharacterized protein LOC125424303 isoform X1 [Ziziphus jujuba var. spinosa]XP_048337300.1 uncharacterized protein LOC107423708 isoform X1 [Ziziphus jujuba var. spinosa]